MGKYDCLIIDDEEALSKSTCEYFNLFNVKTAWVPNENECEKFLLENKVNLILLDINLGDSSGFELCKKLRENLDIPILFISARTSDDDVLLALNIGGDDYIQKPYSLNILLAKVKAVLKRYKIEEKDVFNFCNFSLDFTSKKLLKNKEEIKLKAMEYKLLEVLVKNRGKNLSKDELFLKVWKDTITSDGTLNVHIRRLREKIEENPNDPKIIKTLWGVGYIFEVNEG